VDGQIDHRRSRPRRRGAIDRAARPRAGPRAAAPRGIASRATRHVASRDRASIATATRRVAHRSIRDDRSRLPPSRSIAQLAFVRTRFFSLARCDSFDVALTTSSLPFLRSLKTEKLTAAVTVGTAAALANPLVAEAAITPSLKNTLLSVVAGGIVLAAIGVAVVGVSTFDKVSRK